jgi:hypothetical protein
LRASSDHSQEVAACRGKLGAGAATVCDARHSNYLFPPAPIASPPGTLEELGHKLGISKERVRQIEHRALEKLKSSLLQRSTLPNHLS